MTKELNAEIEAKHGALLDWLEHHIFDTPRCPDVLERQPDVTVADAYRLRAALVERRIAKGDRLLGYKVAGSSRSLRADEHIEGQITGCLMASNFYEDGATVPAGGYSRLAMEGEITVLMKHALRGPNVGLTDVLRAAAGAYASIELIASNRSGSSLQTRIIDGKFSGAYVLGRKLVALDGIDLRLEGMVAYRNGAAMGSATGIEVMSNPLNAVAFVANNLAEVGLQLEPGMLVMTGSLLANLPGAPGERYTMDFTRLGSVSATLG
jgi:2-keto-4-pentenoate hydratase